MEKKYECKVFAKSQFNMFVKNRDPKNIHLLVGINDYSKSPVQSFKPEFKDEYHYLNKRLITGDDAYEVLKFTRTMKSQDEINLMQYICQISDYGHKIIQQFCKPGLYERDLESKFMTTITKNYYTRFWSYPCIGGTGCNSAILHYDINNMVLKDGQLFLADMGIRLCGYTSDVTCTFPVNGKFTPRQKAIYDIVLKSNRASMALMKPGLNFMDCDRKSKDIILQGLQDLKLVNPASLDELYAAKIDVLFMPYKVGHPVGLEVHDIGRLVKFRSDQILDEGNIITIEPGIYFVDFTFENAFKDEKQKKYLNTDLIRTYFDFGGVRIEDQVLVTSTGYLNMNSDLPRTTEEIEKWMSGKQFK